MEAVLSDLSIGGRRVKPGYVTRNVPGHERVSAGAQVRDPVSGDLVVARVVNVGTLDHLEAPCGRRMRLYPGDSIVGAYGNRYATDFYEGYVSAGRETNLLTAGGLVGAVASVHDSKGEPTTLEVIGGLVNTEGRQLSLDDFAQPEPKVSRPPLGTVVVVGSGMNAGKTTTVVSLIRGFTTAGIKVGAGKVTGSGSGKDRWAYVDAGAFAVRDFLDFGMPSTFGYPLDRIAGTMRAICHGLVGDGAEIVVLEIADGILQVETAWLLPRLAGFADAVVFAAVDALSARSGVEIIRSHGLRVGAVSGIVSRSPLATREIGGSVPVLSAAELASGSALELLSDRVLNA